MVSVAFRTSGVIAWDPCSAQRRGLRRSNPLHLGGCAPKPLHLGAAPSTPAVALLLGSNVVSAMLSTFLGNLQERSSDITLVVPCDGRVQRFLLFQRARRPQIASSGRLLFRGRRPRFYSKGNLSLGRNWTLNIIITRAPERFQK